MPPPSPSPLKITIIGSGLAGLTAASILLASGHTITLLERGVPSVATGGQGIILAPNGAKILSSMAFSFERAGGVPIRGIRMYDKMGEMTGEFGLDGREKFGGDFWAMKRSDFRGELVRLLGGEKGGEREGMGTVDMRWETSVVGINCEEGVVTLENGETVEADVVIVADGVHSRLRNFVLQNDVFAAKKTGLTCYRIAVSTDDAKKALGALPLPHWWDPDTCQNSSSVISAGDGTARMVTVYPIRDQTMFNISCILKTEESSKSASDSWNADGDKVKMMESFSDFPEDLRLILGAATEIKVWELQQLSALPTWVRGRTMLIGDAAHAMTPMQGQGANMSVEDAEGLRLLASGTSREDVPGALRLVESLRMVRVAHVADETSKANSTVGVAERVNRNMEYNCSYNGIVDALKKREEGK